MSNKGVYLVLHISRLFIENNEQIISISFYVLNSESHPPPPALLKGCFKVVGLFRYLFNYLLLHL